MKYAIVQQGGKQYKITEGCEILVDRINDAKEGKYEFAKVLMVRDGEEIFIGQPNVTKYKVIGKLIGEVKGEKIRVSKFKAKVRYDKTIGFRPKYTKIIVEKIEKESGKTREKIDKREKKK